MENLFALEVSYNFLNWMGSIDENQIICSIFLEKILPKLPLFASIENKWDELWL
jgi:hypothetical protein